MAFHEGYLSRKEASKLPRKGDGDTLEATTRSARSEVTGPMQTYIDLHRHAAVRNALADHGQVALRLMLAHAIAGSPLWQVRAEPQQSRHEAIDASLANAPAQTEFTTRQADVLALLNLPEDRATVVGGNCDAFQAVTIFARLLALDDDAVLKCLAIVMGETLAAGSALVEAAGLYLNVDLSAVWQPDDAFFDLMRDREVLNAMLAEVAGQMTAKANITEKAKAQKKIIRDCLAGSNGRPQVTGWLPRWIAFPARGYTDRGGIKTVEDGVLASGILSPE